MTQHFDAIIVGSGQAGPALAGRLTSAGMSVAFIAREHFGGTCGNDGCVPTRSPVTSAHAAFVARRQQDFEVTVGGPISVDMHTVKSRKDNIGRASADGVAAWVSRVCPGGVSFGGTHASSDRTLSS